MSSDEEEDARPADTAPEAQAGPGARSAADQAAIDRVLFTVTAAAASDALLQGSGRHGVVDPSRLA